MAFCEQAALVTVCRGAQTRSRKHTDCRPDWPNIPPKTRATVQHRHERRRGGSSPDGLWKVEPPVAILRRVMREKGSLNMCVGNKSATGQSCDVRGQVRCSDPRGEEGELCWGRRVKTFSAASAPARASRRTKCPASSRLRRGTRTACTPRVWSRQMLLGCTRPFRLPSASARGIGGCRL